MQHESGKSVAEYICCLERLFQVAFGHDCLRVETCQTLLYSQLQEGLKYSLVKIPAVSGADSYNQLCIAAKHEEKCLSELSRRQQYLKDMNNEGDTGGRSPHNSNKQNEKCGENEGQSRGEPCQCYVCGSTNHLAHNCRRKKTESDGQTKHKADAGAKIITSKEDPLDFLLPDFDDGVRTVGIQDKGSKPREELVDIQGV